MQAFDLPISEQYPMTPRIYDVNSHIITFEATVLSCSPARNGSFDVVLDRTAFFPGGGGQEADQGTLGGQTLLGLSENEGIVHHYTPVPLEAGEVVTGRVDWEHRFSDMQQHSGEHVLCAVLHNRYGVDNTGFHMGHNAVTMDVNGIFSAEQLAEAELEANAAVYRNLPISVSYPNEDELSGLSYRSKIEIEGATRIVRIGDEDDVLDRCACCAPHVLKTGEIGLIKILFSEHYKGGTRIHILCGLRALNAVNLYQTQVRQIDQLLSALPEETFDAVRKLKDTDAEKKEGLIRMQRRMISLMADQTPSGSDPYVVFETFEDPTSAREFVNLLTARRDGIVALFYPRDEASFAYILATREGSVKPWVKDLNQTLQGRGGGSDAMAQGTVRAARSEIEAFFNR